MSPALDFVTGQTGHCVTSTRLCHRTNRSLCHQHQHPPLTPDKLVTVSPAPAPVTGQTVTVSPAMALVTEQTGHCVSCTKLFGRGQPVDSDLTKCTTSLKRIFKRGNYVSQRSGQKRKLCQTNEWSEEETIQLKRALKRGNCLDQRRV